MSEKKNKNLKVCDEDSKLKHENRTLKLKISDLIKEIVTLKSRIRTVNSAWSKTEAYLREQTEDVDLMDLINEASSGEKFVKKQKSCNKCKSSDVMVRNYKEFKTIKCNSCLTIKRVENDR